MVKPFPTRLEADAEGPAVIVRFYGHLFELSVELTPSAAQALAAELMSGAQEEGWQGNAKKATK